MEKFKLKIVGLKKSVQSRVMITGIHSVPIYIEQIEDKYKEKLNFILNNVKFGLTDKGLVQNALQLQHTGLHML